MAIEFILFVLVVFPAVSAALLAFATSERLVRYVARLSGVH
jgi:hypothetical protein